MYVFNTMHGLNIFPGSGLSLLYRRYKPYRNDDYSDQISPSFPSSSADISFSCVTLISKPEKCLRHDTRVMLSLKISPKSGNWWDQQVSWVLYVCIYFWTSLWWRKCYIYLHSLSPATFTWPDPTWSEWEWNSMACRGAAFVVLLRPTQTPEWAESQPM